MSQPKEHACSECLKKRERCKAASVDEHGEIVWVCPQCWKLYGYHDVLRG